MMGSTFSAFHGDAARKQTALECLTRHWRAGRVMPEMSTSFGDPPVQCSVMGCTIEGNDDETYERELGIPAGVARLHETLLQHCGRVHMPAGPDGALRFEAADFARDYPLQWLIAIRVGADLRPVIPQFVAWLLHDFLDSTQWSLEPQARSVAKLLAALMDGDLSGTPAPEARWVAARLAAVHATDKAKDDLAVATCTFMESVAWSPTTSADEWPTAVASLWFALITVHERRHWTIAERARRDTFARALDEARNAPQGPAMSLHDLIESTPRLKAMVTEMGTPAAQERREQVMAAAWPTLWPVAQRHFEALLRLTQAS